MAPETQSSHPHMKALKDNVSAIMGSMPPLIPESPKIPGILVKVTGFLRDF